MDISVIVVTYNQENTIGRTLDSILSQQTDADYEIVVGDDCSTDGTEAVCREYASRYPDKIVYLRREKNLGLVENYYDCIEHSRGEFLADCAGDDFWVDKYKLQSQWEVMKSDRDVSLVATDWLCCDEMGNNPKQYPGVHPIEKVEVYQPGELLVDIFTHKKMIHLCTALYRKDILTRYLQESREVFINPDNSAEDFQILLGMANAGKIVLLPKVTLYYTVGQESVSHHSDFGKKFDYSYRAIRQARKLQRFFEIPQTKVEESYRNHSGYLCAMALRSGDKSRREKLLEYLNENTESLPLKAQLDLLIMRNSLLWRISRNILNSR